VEQRFSCSKCIILNPALAAEVALYARERLSRSLLKKAFFNDAFPLDVENAIFQQTVTMGPAHFTVAA